MTGGGERKHAVLSPSAASRWLACTPSARLEERFPDTAGEYAKEGTLAHAFCETLLRGMAMKEAGAGLEALRADALYSPEMEGHAGDYAAYVWAKLQAARAETPDARLYVEERIDLSAYAPECFGTADAVVIADGAMDVVDFKYGKGVAVDARENRQMMLYALGALERFAWLYDIRRVRMSIFQPRIGNVSEWGMEAGALRRWGEEELRPRAAMAFRGGGDPEPGAWCRFCRAKAQCRALARRNMEAARKDFAGVAPEAAGEDGPGLMTEEETVAVLDEAAGIRAWLDAVEKFALDEALKGRKWPGWKLVEGRSVRKYTDEKKVAEALLAGGIPEDQIWQPRQLKTITAMEKMLTKKGFDALAGGLVEKPRGKPALAPEGDKRPEWSSAEADFAGITTD